MATQREEGERRDPRGNLRNSMEQLWHTALDGDRVAWGGVTYREVTEWINCSEQDDRWWRLSSAPSPNTETDLAASDL